MKYFRKICIILFLSVIIGGAFLFKIYEENKITHTPNYKVYIYDDGSATIYANNIAYIQQKEDGTLIIEGGGKSIDYEYPRRETIRGRQ